MHKVYTDRRSPCGERGLKCQFLLCVFQQRLRRSPCGERGLKFSAGEPGLIWNLSLPVRGAWVEMSRASFWKSRRICRSPCGERGLKSV